MAKILILWGITEFFAIAAPSGPRTSPKSLRKWRRDLATD